jgi:hypothetical protein
MAAHLIAAHPSTATLKPTPPAHRIHPRAPPAPPDPPIASPNGSALPAVTRSHQALQPQGLRHQRTELRCSKRRVTNATGLAELRRASCITYAAVGYGCVGVSFSANRRITHDRSPDCNTVHHY